MPLAVYRGQLQQAARHLLPRWLASGAGLASAQGIASGADARPNGAAPAAVHQPSATPPQNGGPACQGLYVANMAGRRNNSPILIGLLDFFERQRDAIGYFQPIGGPAYPHAASQTPRHIELLKAAFELAGDPQRMVGVSQQEAVDLLVAGKVDDLLDRIYAAYDSYRAARDFVVLEGIAAGPHGLSNSTELNARIAAALGTPVLAVVDGRPRSTAADLFTQAVVGCKEFQTHKADVAGVIMNKLPADDFPRLLAQLRAQFERAGLPFAGGLPVDELLSSVRLDEMAAALGASMVYGRKDMLDTEVGSVMVASGTLHDVLEEAAAHEKERPLVLTARDRTDVLIALLAAQSSAVGPYIAGMVLGEGRGFGGVADRLLRNAFEPGQRLGGAAGVPVMQVDKPLYDVALITSGITGSILPTSARKIERAKQLFAEHVDTGVLAKQLAMPKAAKLTPKMFVHSIYQKCCANPQRIVLPEAQMDRRVLTAAAELARKGLASLVLLGQREALEAQAKALNLDIRACNIVDPQDPTLLERYVDVLMEARKGKGLARDRARDSLADVNVFGTMMVLTGDADGMVSGAVHTTASTIRPALQVLRRPDRPVVSSIFFMCLPDKVLVYGDCAVVVDPTPEQLAVIAVTSAETAQAFGMDPRVALLSYSTGQSGGGPLVEKVVEAVKIAKGVAPGLALEGPLQYDAAVDPEVARVKVKGESQVAGRANVLIFPDLNTGNNTYKAVQQSTGAVAIGPLMQGLRKPVNDLSRGCTVPDIVNTVACTSVQAIFTKQQAIDSATTHAAMAA